MSLTCYCHFACPWAPAMPCYAGLLHLTLTYMLGSGRTYGRSREYQNFWHEYIEYHFFLIHGAPLIS